MKPHLLFFLVLFSHSLFSQSSKSGRKCQSYSDTLYVVCLVHAKDQPDDDEIVWASFKKLNDLGDALENNWKDCVMAICRNGHYITINSTFNFVRDSCEWFPARPFETIPYQPKLALGFDLIFENPKAYVGMTIMKAFVTYYRFPINSWEFFLDTNYRIDSLKETKFGIRPNQVLKLIKLDKSEKRLLKEILRTKLY